MRVLTASYYQFIALIIVCKCQAALQSWPSPTRVATGAAAAARGVIKTYIYCRGFLSEEEGLNVWGHTIGKTMFNLIFMKKSRFPLLIPQEEIQFLPFFFFIYYKHMKPNSSKTKSISLI